MFSRSVAQLAERRSPKPQVGGSIPSWPDHLMKYIEQRDTMNQKANFKLVSSSGNASSFDAIKWTLVFLLLIAGIVANTYFNEVAVAIRTACGLVLVAAMMFLVFQTSKGRVFWTFVQASRQEMRKVVWPTRPETIHTTLIVVAMVVVAALVLWGFDTLFFWLVGWLTGQRG
jgi:preprotein translocase subunit SecE